MTNLARVLSAYQQKHDIEGRKMAQMFDCSESTLTRIKQGRMPDAATFARIVAWLAEEE